MGFDTNMEGGFWPVAVTTRRWRKYAGTLSRAKRSRRMGGELLAEELRGAASKRKLPASLPPFDLPGRIFSSFCIGK